MNFSEFSQYLQQLEGTPSRLGMTAILSEVYKKLQPAEIEQANYLLEGRLFPQYRSLQFQLSIKMVIRALARIVHEKIAAADAKSGDSLELPISLFGESDFSLAEETVTKQYKKLGDIGLVAEVVLEEAQAAGTQELLTTAKKSTLTIQQVYDHLVAIAREGGEGSQERKVLGVVELLKKIDPISAKFVSRIIVGSLRLGFSTMTMLDSLSWAVTGTKIEAPLLEEAYQKKADIGKLAATYLSQTSEAARKKALSDYSVEVGIPIVPQLCQWLDDHAKVIEKMKEVYAEAKYDGLRTQIHINKAGIAADGNVKIKVFTRNLEDASHMFPELSEFAQLIKAESVILDGEAIGYDPATGKLLPFQETITRKRKHDIEEATKSVPLKYFIFDVLSIDGESLLATPLRERKERLDKSFTDTEQFVKTKFLITKDPKVLQNFHEEQLALGLEGVVVKRSDSPYQSGRKGWHWVKIKQKVGTVGKLTDTLDCVVMGYYVGRGKRTEFGIGAFLVGILTGEKTVVTIAKIGTGITDEMLGELKTRCDVLKTEKQPNLYDVPKELFPDVWIQPELVVEIAADEITKSPMHSAGVALRFPRLVKIRDDKTWQDSTTVSEVQQIVIA